MSFLGIDCELKSGIPADLPAEQVIAAYDLFEAVIESGLDSMSAGSVAVSSDKDTVIIIETDAKAIKVDSGWQKKIMKTAGLELTVAVIDDMFRFTLSSGGDDDG